MMDSGKAMAIPLEARVYPSEEKTICVMVPEGDIYGGAHLYYVTNCLGFENGKTHYQYEDTEEDGVAGLAPIGQRIQFVQKNDDGSIIPGLQSEQLVYVLLDRAIKLNARFPSVQNEKMIAGLNLFLDACRERVTERMSRGVMGELKK